MAFVNTMKMWLANSIIATACILSLTMVLIPLLSPWYVTNIDDSLPGLIYEIDRSNLPYRHDVVGIKVPANPYYPDGAPFLKIIAGMPGDTVTRKDRMFYVNGQFVAEAKEFTKAGNPLTPGPSGVIPPGHYFVWTPHKDSYDSRYNEIGWITTQHILGTARRLL